MYNKISIQNLFLLALLLFTTFLVNPCLSELCHPEEKKALLQIKQAFNNHPDFSTWDPNTDCCPDWYGTSCDDAGHLTSLYYMNGVFRGQLPPQLGDLPYLNSIYFNNNTNIVGPLPPALVKLKLLRTLLVTNCGLTGTVPEFLGQMDLITIGLNNNKLTGPLPSSLAALPQLGSLELQQNRIQGPIPASYGSFQSTSFYLNFSHNQLSGKIPASLGDKIDFASIDLSSNRLEGDATPLFGREKTELIRLYLSRNLLSFDFSKVTFPKTLTELDISYNKIYGSLPQELGELSLKYLNVSNNQLCGKIPVFSNLPKKIRASAYLNNRCLCGAPLPRCKN